MQTPQKDLPPVRWASVLPGAATFPQFDISTSRSYDQQLAWSLVPAPALAMAACSRINGNTGTSAELGKGQAHPQCRRRRGTTRSSISSITTPIPIRLTSDLPHLCGRHPAWRNEFAGSATVTTASDTVGAYINDNFKIAQKPHCYRRLALGLRRAALGEIRKAHRVSTLRNTVTCNARWRSSGGPGCELPATRAPMRSPAPAWKSPGITMTGASPEPAIR